MADVQRAGWIGRNKFDLNLALAACRRTPKRFALRQNRTHYFKLRGREQVEVNKAGAGDFGFGNKRRFWDFGEQKLREFTRVPLHWARQLHCQIAGKIAM